MDEYKTKLNILVTFLTALLITALFNSTGILQLINYNIFSTLACLVITISVSLEQRTIKTKYKVLNNILTFLYHGVLISLPYSIVLDLINHKLLYLPYLVIVPILLVNLIFMHEGLRNRILYGVYIGFLLMLLVIYIEIPTYSVLISILFFSLLGAMIVSEIEDYRKMIPPKTELEITHLSISRWIYPFRLVYRSI